MEEVGEEVTVGVGEGKPSSPFRTSRARSLEGSDGLGVEEVNEEVTVGGGDDIVGGRERLCNVVDAGKARRTAITTVSVE